VDLFKGVTNLSVLTSTSGEGFDLTIFANADLTSENVIVISATGTGGGSPPDITFVPANPNNNDHDSYIPNPPPTTRRTNLDEFSSLEEIFQPHLKGTVHATGILRVEDYNLNEQQRTTIYTSLSPVLESEDAASEYVRDMTIGANSTSYSNLVSGRRGGERLLIRDAKQT